MMAPSELKELNRIGAIKHFNEFEAKAQKIGIEKLKRLILARIKATDIIKACETGEGHLNEIPLAIWNALAGGLKTSDYSIFRALARPYVDNNGKSMISLPSLSDKLCSLKHVAKYYIGNMTPPETCKKSEGF